MKQKHPHRGKDQPRRFGRHGRKQEQPQKRRTDGPPEREGPRRVVGTLSHTAHGWRLQSANRRARGEFVLQVKGSPALKQGELAVAEILPSRSRFGPREARLIDVLGDMDSPRAVSLIAIATHDIPHEFSRAALDEAAAAKPVTLENRTDLRHLPLITIDGEDARDFDDAVFAEPHDDGWHLIVAIADVAHYVRHDSPLDKTAYERGNSVYFPDRVVPMLPEALSNELCSLKPHVERACMAVHMWIDRAGEMTRWQFVRGVMRSHARTTYEQIQRAVDGRPDDVTAPLLDKVIRPLYGAYKCLMSARLNRGTLELDLPERKVEIDDKGRVRAIKVRARLDSHKLIEEFMISANVAAAAQLEGKGGFCLYRVHDRPTELKLQGLRDFLATLDIGLVPGRQMHPRYLTKILEDHAGGPHAQVINEMMLRTQAQAIYSPANIGHFGLALAKYAHFTSPIRRYADLVVHRGLIRACKLGTDGLTDLEAAQLEVIADHISTTERRAAAAERDAVDRFVTLYMADKVGAVFPARISGVAKFGLFARLDETGADGIIPLSSLPNDYYHFDEKKQAYIGRRTKRVFQLAQAVAVRLEQADRLTGSMSFSIVEKKDSASGKISPGKRKKQKHHGNKNKFRRHRQKRDRR
ncbi:MAG: ribonuclease R [Bdellovibrionales bacterium]